MDAHAHLQHEAFAHDLDAVLERARAAGLARILVPGWDRASSEAALILASRHPDLLNAAVGIHPHHAAGATAADWQALERLAAEPAAAAVGEIGLDYSRNLSPPDAQRDALARQLELAAVVRKPVIVHDRDAHEDITVALLGHAPRVSGVPGMLHAYSGDAAMASVLTAAGYVISFALPVTFRANRGPRAAAAALPAAHLLVETDSPYLGGLPTGATSRRPSCEPPLPSRASEMGPPRTWPRPRPPPIGVSSAHMAPFVLDSRAPRLIPSVSTLTG